MRIVIDMQSVQLASSVDEASRVVLSLLQHLAQQSDQNEVYLALCSARPKSIEPIRHAFSGLISQSHIRVWHALESQTSAPASQSEASRWRNQTAELIRAAFVASFEPDIVFIPVIVETIDDGIIFSDLADPRFVAAVALTAKGTTSASKVVPLQGSYNSKNFERLSHSDLLIALPPLTVDTVSQYFEVRPERVNAGWVTETASAEQQLVDMQAKHLLGLFRECLATKQGLVYRRPSAHLPTNSRPKLAYLSPLPPERSGISDYSAALLPNLAKFYDIDVIVSQVEISTPWIVGACGVRTPEWFLTNAHLYNRVLYHFGNSGYHQHMFDLLARVPGVVVLHDFYLADAQHYREAYGLSPYAWTRELYKSLGYTGVSERFKEKNSASLVAKYPANLSVLEHALGVIVHSAHSMKLASTWYGKDFSSDWRLIPLLKIPNTVFDRTQARTGLGLNEDDFVVCSFGLLGPTKLNHQLLEAWIKSRLAKDKRCRLVFVGDTGSGHYGDLIEETIRSVGLGDRIQITGWADTQKFQNYLAAADLAVQLRTQSRGETSAAVLDCMNYGLPTIVNANGAMAELPNDSVYMMPDAFENNDLLEALEALWSDSKRRATLGVRAKIYVSNRHAPSECAEQYRQAIEHFTSRVQLGRDGVPALVKAVAELTGYLPSSSECLQLASSMARSLTLKTPLRQLLVDVSATCRDDLKTGIQRVVRALVWTLIHNAPLGYRIEPVYLTDEGGVWHYRYARKWVSNILDIPESWALDDPVDYAPADAVLVADFTGPYAVEGERAGLYQQLRDDGVTLHFVVYDLLPIHVPDFFPPGQRGFSDWLESITKIAHSLICISQTVADELRVWSKDFGPKRLQPAEFGWFHLGADIKSSIPSHGIPEGAALTLSWLAAKPSFLMVGTIEPRKGYLQTLDAFSLLWAQGIDVNLVIVGKEGWRGMSDDLRRTIPEIVRRLRNHPEITKRLIWLEDISDEYLAKVYDVSICLIAASEAEGFGLPLIEAAQQDIPLIARDIPVFREVAGEHAHYFSGADPSSLANSVQCWLELHDRGAAPKSGGIKFLTWEQSAHQLLRCIQLSEPAQIGSTESII